MNANAIQEILRSLQLAKYVWSASFILIIACLCYLIWFGQHEFNLLHWTEYIDKCLAAAFLCVLAVTIRNSIFKAGWHEHAATPHAYRKGMLALSVFLTCIQFGLLTFAIATSAYATTIPAAILPCLFQTLTFPNIRPMLPTLPPEVQLAKQLFV